jgi:hypothetical protein
MAFEKKPGELGALWARESAKGPFLSGTLDVDGQQVEIVCYPISSQNPKAPAWRVMKSTPRNAAPAPVQSPDSDDMF